MLSETPPHHYPTRDGEITALRTNGRVGSRELDMTFVSLGHLLRVFAMCRTCSDPVETGLQVTRRQVPLVASGQWKCRCGGIATLPDRLLVRDAGTREEVVIIPRERERTAVTAVTLAELLRLSQAARAVQEGRAGASERLDQVLAEAPEPIRRLRDRLPMAEWTRDQRLMLAGIIVTLVAALVPLLKDDGAVTEEQLVEIIEQLVDQQSDTPGQQGQPKEGRASSAGSAGAEERGTSADTLGSDGGGSPPEVQRDQGVGDPDQ